MASTILLLLQKTKSIARIGLGASKTIFSLRISARPESLTPQQVTAIARTPTRASRVARARMHGATPQGNGVFWLPVDRVKPWSWLPSNHLPRPALGQHRFLIISSWLLNANGPVSFALERARGEKLQSYPKIGHPRLFSNQHRVPPSKPSTRFLNTPSE